MANRHQVFTQSLRNIMQNEEKRLRETDQKRGDEDIDEDNLLLQEMLEVSSMSSLVQLMRMMSNYNSFLDA